MILLGCNSAGECVFVYSNVSDHTYVIGSNADWSIATWTEQARSSTYPWTAGDVFKVKRIGSTYTVYYNGASIVNWTDSGNIVPRDSSHRLVGIGAYSPDGNGSRTIDSFSASSGGGTPTGPADDFNRADSSSGLGSDWTNQYGVMGISSNRAYPAAAGQYSQASWNTPLGADDMELTITLGPLVGTGRDSILCSIGKNTAGEGVALYRDISTATHILSEDTWVTSNVSRASATVSVTAGDTLTLRRVGSLYTILKNGTTTGITWDHTGGIVPCVTPATAWSPSAPAM